MTNGLCHFRKDLTQETIRIETPDLLDFVGDNILHDFKAIVDILATFQCEDMDESDT
jgi:hypothetical protein